MVKTIVRKVTLTTLIITACFMVCLPAIPQVSAEPLSPAEKKAVNLYPNWVTYVCGEGAAEIGGQPGVGAPNGAAYPDLDPTAMAESIDAFIKKENPDSKLNGLGSTIVASSEKANVSPFLIVAIAYMESGLANPGDYNVANGNNAFGRSATTAQPNFQGAKLWYKWSSVKASVDYEAPENKNVPGGGDMATYLRNQFGKQIDSGSLEQVFNLYDPGNGPTYAANVKKWVDELVKGANNGQAAPVAPTPQELSEECCESVAAGGVVEGKNDKATIWNYLVSEMGLSANQAAGIMGNIQQESGFDPNAVNPDSGAYGIIQWYAGRETALANYAASKGKPKSDLGVQLEFMKKELESTYKDAVLEPIENTDDLEKVVRIWLEYYEIPCAPPGSACDYEVANRLPFAQDILKEFGDVAVPSTGSLGGCPSASGGSGEPVVIGDYAWPVDIGKSELDSGYPWPCQGNCHHDNTPAFDLSTKKAVGGDDNDVVGRSMFAINEGTIDYVHVYNGIPGCYIFQLSGKDGWKYAYIHARNPSVKPGQKVKVGDKVAEVGERKCTGNGSYPHLHIDRGSPKGGPAGYVSSRDSGLVQILNKLYENLP